MTTPPTTTAPVIGSPRKIQASRAARVGVR
jgi:hypothetical protein